MTRTGYYLVHQSPLPIGIAFMSCGLALSVISFSWNGLVWYVCLSVSLSVLGLSLGLIQWWMILVKENCYLGKYTTYEIRNYYWGFLLFILSEWFFFFSFFWAFVHCSVGQTSIHGVGNWPVKGIIPLCWYKIPAINTFVIISSWPSSVWAHKAVKLYNKISEQDMYIFSSGGEMSKYDISVEVEKDFNIVVENLKGGYSGYNFYNDYVALLEAFSAFAITIFLGILFTGLQVFEYYVASFSISDGVFGCTFFMLTGFHGMHVIVGTIFLIICCLRLLWGHFDYKHFTIALKQCIWYWHFVDVIWLFVYALVYIWGTY